MTQQRIDLGQYGENTAAHFLERRGYQILESNYRTRFGEIDIIAKEKDVICFVEVKTRTTPSHGNAFESVTPQKQKKLVRLALGYLEKNNLLDVAARFDVVAIDPHDPQHPQIQIVKNAFEIELPS